MKYRSYPEYNDSGIKLPKKVPKNWQINKLKHIITPNGLIRGPFGSSLKTEFFVKEGYKVYEQKNCIRKDPYLGESYVNEDKYNELIRFSVKKNDILMSCSGTIGKIVKIPSDYSPGIINQALLIMRFFDIINISYFQYIFNSDFIQNQIYDNSLGSAMKNLVGMDIFKNIDFILPPKDDQEHIIAFLDKKASEIDNTIKKDTQLIELLKEKRSALINHIVTKGLDPDAKMKDSGMEMIKEIPKNWNIMKLKNIVSTKITDGPHETPELLDGGIPFISAEAIKNDKIDFSRMRGFISEKLHKIYSNKCKPQKNDIFLIKSGATTGNVAMVETDEEFSIWSPLALIRANKNIILPRLLYYILLSDYFKRTIEVSWSYGTQQNIGMGVIENLGIVIPDIHEQSNLSIYLDTETSKIDKIIGKIENKIKLMEEYKKSLIHHVVTGKVDVRGDDSLNQIHQKKDSRQTSLTI